MSNINLKGCPKAVRSELEAIHNNYLENGFTGRVLHGQKEERDFLKYLFFFNKLISRKNKGRK